MPSADPAAPPAPQARAFDVVVAVLGAVTIAAYGSTYYAFGVLIEPIHADTGWSRGTLGSAYALSLVLGGIGATVAGALVDRFGGRRLLLVAATVGTGLLGSTAAAPNAGWFVVQWGAGAGLIGALAFYHVTIVVMVRARGSSDPRAYAALTFIGGLSSPIYLPLTALAVERLGWRPTQVLLASSLALLLAVAALLVPNRPSGGAGEHRAGPRAALDALRLSLGDPLVRIFVVAVAIGSVVGTALHTFQIPAMVAAGIGLATASSLAAIRGLCSLPGRALLAVVVRRTSAEGALLGAYLVMTIGTLLLLGAGSGFAPAYAVVTGIAYGSLLPLQALVAADLFPSERLGTLMGAQQGLNSFVAAGSPIAAGMLIDRTGSYTTLLIVVAAGFAISSAMLVRLVRAGRRPIAAPPDRPDTEPGTAHLHTAATTPDRPRGWARTRRRSPEAAST